MQMFRARQFGDEQLESAYRAGQRRRRIERLIAALYAIVLALLFIALNHLFRLDLALLWATVSAAIALGLIIRLNILTSTPNYENSAGTMVFTIAIVFLWLAVASLCALATISALTLLPTIIGVFVFYTALPVGLSGAIVGGTSLSLVHLTAFILSAANVESQTGDGVDALLHNPNSRAIVEQLVAQLIAHIWVNFVGVYLFTARNRLCRAVFLNVRNALASQRDAATQFARMGSLLRASLPPHVIADVRQQLGVDVPRVYVEYFSQACVILCRLYGLQAVLDQLSVQDSARLLNEFHYRIDQLVDRYNFVRLRSDAIVVVAGILLTEENSEAQRPLQAYHFAKDLTAIFRSFSDATTANIQLRIGIGSGALSCGIVGVQKWHYDVVGEAYDNAERLESLATAEIVSSILIDDLTNATVSQQFVTERTVEKNSWRIISYRTSSTVEIDEFNTPYCMRSGFQPSLLFSSAQKRFSMVTVPQAISCLLQSSAVASAASGAARLTAAAGVTAPLSAAVAIPCASVLNCSTGEPQLYSVGRRKKRKSADYSKSLPKSSSDMKTLLSSNDATVDKRRESAVAITATPLLHLLTQRFVDSKVEVQYTGQVDRWLIPALAISILFLVINTFYQMLVQPCLLSTLLIGAGGLFILLAVMLLLYVKYCESFCQFVTRTTVGYSITVLLILVILFLCVIVNAFSCEVPHNSPSGVVVIAGGEGACREVHYAAGSVALWTLTAALFIRFGFFRLLCVTSAALAAYGIHVFGTHFDFYARYSQRLGWRVDYDIVIALATLALIALFQARRNERLLRMDFLFVLKTVNETRRLKHIELLNDQLVFSALPAHIAHHYLTRSDTYQHICQSVGVLCARIGTSANWQSERGFDRLNRAIFALDETLVGLPGVEKVRSAHCTYVCAVGVQPESANANTNINDAPRTIGDLLATLAEFALQIQQFANSEGLSCSIGMDCGPALSLVLGQKRPQYELVGVPCERAALLMRHASDGVRISVSEEIHLALRPRAASNGAAFEFGAGEPLAVAPGLSAYVLLSRRQLERQNSQENHGQSRDTVYTTCKANYNLKTGPATIPEQLDPTNTKCQSPTPMTPPVNGKCVASGPTVTKLRQLDDTHITRQQIVPTLTAAVKEMKRTAVNDSCTTVSLSSLSLSATDFDEVDERVTAAACAQKWSAMEANAVLPPDAAKIQASELPSDLRELAKDKRMSGYFDDYAVQRRRGDARHVAEHNPFEAFTSLNSSFSSELYSVDMSVESDSEIEWITPEMAAYGNDSGRYFAKQPANKFAAVQSRTVLLRHLSAHSSRRALHDAGSDMAVWRSRRQNSDQMSDRGWKAFSSRLRRKRFHVSLNGPRLPVWLKSASRMSLSSQFTAASSRSRRASYSALDRLDAAARLVDEMLQELASVDDNTYGGRIEAPTAECSRFPIYGESSSLNASMNALVDYGDASTRCFGAPSHRELSSACHTDYDNAEKDPDICSDPELSEIYRNASGRVARKDGAVTLAQKLKRVLLGLSDESLGAGALPPFPPTASITRGRLPAAQRSARAAATSAYEADVDSNCSSLASSLMFLNAAGKGAGVRPLSQRKASAVELLRRNSVHSVGYDNEYELVSESDYGADSDLNVDAAPRRADGAFDPTRTDTAPKFPAIDAEDGGGEVRALSRDIRREFGDYELAGFPNI